MARQPPSDVKPRALDRQNRVALPAEVLRALELSPGDYVAFEVDGDKVRLRKVRWVLDR